MACRDFGGSGPPVLLLHGLAGHAGEWAATAAWLTATHHVLASDARGHGRSERRPADVSRDAHVADAAGVIEQLALEPAVVVGQSFGGLTALSLAARRPELVRALVVVEASPHGGPEAAEEEATDITRRLQQWPVPFRSCEHAEAFFTDRFGSAPAAEAYAAGLERRRDGWWPRFDVDVLGETLRQALSRPSWGEWEQVRCPTLIVRAGDGLLDTATVAGMLNRLPTARAETVAGAGHDVHLSRPGEWRRRLTVFLAGL